MESSSLSPTYELIYWPGGPGRGEHIRLALEEGGATYSDTGHNLEKGMEIVGSYYNTSNLGDSQNPPPFAPPILKHGDLTISQTPNILFYLAPQLGLAGSGNPNDVFKINALAMTALDALSTEVHDCHHPISKELNYEEQRDESIRKSKEWVSVRLPKHLGYFQRVISGEASEDGPWLFGGVLTWADLVLFQCLDGTMYQFPRAIELLKISGEFNKVFELYETVKTRPNIAHYLASKRRWPYTHGIFRYYKELDVIPK